MSDLPDLADRVRALSPAERLRIAADLLECGRRDVAQLLIDQVRGELELARLTTARTAES